MFNAFDNNSYNNDDIQSPPNDVQDREQQPTASTHTNDSERIRELDLIRQQQFNAVRRANQIRMTAQLHANPPACKKVLRF